MLNNGVTNLNLNLGGDNIDFGLVEPAEFDKIRGLEGKGFSIEESFN
jgi:hypothetical protein